MAEVAALHLRAAELVEDQVVFHAPLLLMRSRLVRRWLAASNVNRSTTSTFNALAKFSKPGHGRGIHAALDQTDELHRAADPLRKLDLRQSPLLAQVGDPLAKFLLKHGV